MIDLQNEILNCLAAYKIDINEIYSITTNNGANVIKASKLIENELIKVLNVRGKLCIDFLNDNGRLTVEPGTIVLQNLPDCVIQVNLLLTWSSVITALRISP